MKTIFTLLFSILVFSASGRNAAFEKLCEVNTCWKEQKNIDPALLPAYKPMNEKEWIRLHLSLVERVLRARGTGGLTAAQRHNRLQCLNYLHGYWLAGNFPVNENHNYRTPIFIDKHDNFCAVGYLVKATGNENISRKIAAQSNLAYVREMDYPELQAWAVQNGFTVDELAWIQPSYPPLTFSDAIGHGVDGEVNELYADSATGRLFVGGTFINADSSITANNIAYITASSHVYTWHNMGAGVNGTVNSITGYDGKIFAAGSFSAAGGSPVNNVAYWDGSAWYSAGCISGTVNNLVVFQNNLYAAGSFDVCDTAHNINFAKWNGAAWQPLPGLSGHINTMEAMGAALLLGGAFSYGADTVNAIKWDSAGGFVPLSNVIDNEVKDFQLFQDTMYAVCKQTSATDSVNLFLKLSSNAWYPAFTDTAYMARFARPSVDTSISFNTLCADSAALNMGGAFEYSPPAGVYASNCFNMALPGFYGTENWFIVDSAVNKMVIFDSALIAGGKFKLGYNGYYGPGIPLNGIAKRHVSYDPASVAGLTNPRTLDIYPNPVTSSDEITIENNFSASHFALRGMDNKLITEGALKNSRQQTIMLPQLAACIYLIEVSNGNGGMIAKKITIE